MAKKETKYYGPGKRKSSVAKVTLTEGKGNITENGKDVHEYFPFETKVMDLVQPLELTNTTDKFDVEATQIKSISISVTRNFYDVMNKLITNDKPAINLFIGKVVLYRAETIPIYHNKMRFKFYNATNGEIDHYGKQDDSDTFAIRKIGAVLDYD